MVKLGPTFNPLQQGLVLKFVAPGMTQEELQNDLRNFFAQKQQFYLLPIVKIFFKVLSCFARLCTTFNYIKNHFSYYLS